MAVSFKCKNCGQLHPERTDAGSSAQLSGVWEESRSRAESDLPPVETTADVNAENERKRLEDTIAKGVERGVLQAVGIDLLITALIAFNLPIVRAT